MKTPAFQFYPKDWLTDFNVVTMSPEERGIYIQLLAHMWLTEDCSLPNDVEQLQRLSGGGHDLVIAVLRCFIVLDANRITHKRLIEEREKQKSWKEKSSVAGKKGAKSRWGSQKTKHGVGHKMVIDERWPNDDSSFSSSSSSSNTKDPPTSHAVGSSDFRDFIQKFNELTGRQYVALPKYQAQYKARLKLYTPDQILQAVTSASKDSFLRGANDKGTDYLTVEYILRNDAQIDKYLNFEQRAGSGKRYAIKINGIEKEVTKAEFDAHRARNNPNL